MGENLLRRLGEKLTLLIVRGLVEGGGDSLGFGLPSQFLGRSPIGAAVVERIQNNVAALGGVEAANELTSRVVDDGGGPGPESAGVFA